MNGQFETEEDLKALFDPGRGIEVPGDVEERMRGRLGWLRDRVGSPGAAGGILWRLPWVQIRWQALPVAAAFLIFALGAGGLWLLLVGGGSSPAFARVLDSIRAFRPYAFTEAIHHEGYPDVTKHILRKSLTQRRETWPDGSVHVFDLSADPVRILSLYPSQKRALEKELTGLGPAQDPDLLQLLANAQSAAAVSLGKKRIDGKMALGFHLPGPANDWTVWVDPKTLLPIRIELRQPTIKRTIVMTDFDFEAHWDDALFDTTAPEGYSVEKVREDGTTPTEEDLVQGLRVVATLLDGQFPPSLEWPELQQTLRDHYLRKGQTPSEEQIKTLRECYPRVQRFLGILKAFERVRNLEYVGEGVHLGDGDATILRWQPRGSDAWRVVFGDLSIREVASQKLPDPTAPQPPASKE